MNDQIVNGLLRQIIDLQRQATEMRQAMYEQQQRCDGQMAQLRKDMDKLKGVHGA